MLLNKTQVQLRHVKYAEKQYAYPHDIKQGHCWITLYFMDSTRQEVRYADKFDLMESDFIKLGKALERMDGAE